MSTVDEAAAAAASADAVELRASQWQAALEVLAGGSPWLGSISQATRLGLGDVGLRDLAIKGWQSHVRAYACHSRELRPFFNPREVHLGHAARAFGLADPPAELARQARQARSQPRESARDDSEAKSGRGRTDAGQDAPRRAEGGRQAGAGDRGKASGEGGRASSKDSRRESEPASSAPASGRPSGGKRDDVSMQLALAASMEDSVFAPSDDEGEGANEASVARSAGAAAVNKPSSSSGRSAGGERGGKSRPGGGGNGGSSRGQAHAYWKLYGPQAQPERGDSHGKPNGKAKRALGRMGAGKGRMGLSAQSMASEFSA